MTYVPVDGISEPVVAFAIGRRFGSAVVRNRARRRIRAALATVVSSWPAPVPYALLVQARPAVLTQPFAGLLDDVAHLLGAVTAPAARR